MFASKALLACYTILELVQLGETGREISGFFEPLPKETKLSRLNFKGEVSFSRKPSVVTSAWNGKLILSFPPENQQPISAGTVNQPDVEPAAIVTPAEGTENQTGPEAAAELLEKLIPSNEATKKKLEKKEMEKRKKRYQSLKGKYTIYIKALPGVVSGVTTLYPVLYDEKWSIDDSYEKITIAFKNFTIPEWDIIEIALDPRSQRGILEKASNRLYIYDQFGDPLLLVIDALTLACTQTSLVDKNFPQSFPPLFVTKRERGKDIFYDVGCNSPLVSSKIRDEAAVKDEAAVNAEADVFVVDVAIIKSYYNTELKFYDLDIDGQRFVASRNKENTSPFLLQTNLDPTYAPMGQIKKVEFSGPKAGCLTEHWKDRWGSRHPQKWKWYNFTTELCVVDGTQIGYNLRQIMEPKQPIHATKPRENKSAKRLQNEPWVLATVTFTKTKFTFRTPGSKTTNTYSSQHTGWIKQEERFIWIHFTRGVDGLDNDYIARRSASDKAEVTEVKGNVTVGFDNKLFTVNGVRPEGISVTPEHNDETAFLFSFTRLVQINKP